MNFLSIYVSGQYIILQHQLTVVFHDIKFKIIKIFPISAVLINLFVCTQNVIAI